MADGGQGFLKICATILPENYQAHHDIGICDEEMDLSEEFAELNSPVKKRSLYENGGTAGRKGKLTGVTRIVMLAACMCAQSQRNLF